jgi:hypothetical protein
MGNESETRRVERVDFSAGTGTLAGVCLAAAGGEAAVN